MRNWFLGALLVVAVAAAVWAGEATTPKAADKTCGNGDSCCGMAAPSQQQVEYLQSLNYYVGAWTGGGEISGMGAFTHKVTYEPVFGGNFIRGNYEATCATQGVVAWQEAQYMGWDVDNNRPSFTFFGMDGSIGNATKVEIDGAKVMTEYHCSGLSSMKDMRRITTRVDQDTFTLAMETRNGEQWAPFFTSTYQRQK